jgi:hypothetical protein
LRQLVRNQVIKVQVLGYNPDFLRAREIILQGESNLHSLVDTLQEVVYDTGGNEIFYPSIPEKKVHKGSQFH